MMTCKHVSTLLSTGQLAYAPWGQRLGVRLHLMMCRHCSAVKRHLVALGRAARSLAERFGAEPSSNFEARLLDELRGFVECDKVTTEIPGQPRGRAVR